MKISISIGILTCKCAFRQKNSAQQKTTLKTNKAKLDSFEFEHFQMKLHTLNHVNVKAEKSFFQIRLLNFIFHSTTIKVFRDDILFNYFSYIFNIRHYIIPFIINVFLLVTSSSQLFTFSTHIIICHRD
jgi:hypothetical protein